MSVLSALFEKRMTATDFVNDDGWWGGSVVASGARVNRESAMRLSAVWACVRILTNAIATLPTDIVVSVGGRRFVEFTRPEWLLHPDPADPTMTWTEHVAQVTTSLLLDGNSFTYAPGSVLEPQALVVLDPRRVDVRSEGRRPVYDIRDENGRIVRTVGPQEMLHGMWLRMPGALRGLSPIDAARQAIGLGLTAEEFGARYFSQGSTLSFGVETPGPMTDQQREDLRKGLEDKHAGVRRAHSISVITAGAKFVTGLGITNDQAQFLELRKFQVEDIARWYGIPPHMLGSQEPGASSYNSVEQRGLEFREYAVLPLVRRIEDAYDRLVEPSDRLRLAGATASLKFNLSGLARADLKSRFEAYQVAVGGPFMTADEARELEDRAPIDGGDKVYVQSQMVPLGTAPQPPAPSRPTSEASS